MQNESTHAGRPPLTRERAKELAEKVAIGLNDDDVLVCMFLTLIRGIADEQDHIERDGLAFDVEQRAFSHTGRFCNSLNEFRSIDPLNPEDVRKLQPGELREEMEKERGDQQEPPAGESGSVN